MSTKQDIIEVAGRWATKRAVRKHGVRAVRRAERVIGFSWNISGAKWTATYKALNAAAEMFTDTIRESHRRGVLS